MIMRGAATARVLLMLALIAVCSLVPSSSEYEGTGIQRRACTVALHLDAPGLTMYEHAVVCDALEKAAAFFKAYGIDARHAIRLRVEREPLNPSRPHLGAYSHATQTVRLLGLDRIEPHHALFGLPVDRRLYESVVVHEMAHAIAAQHFKEREPAVVFQEYLAYVVQISTMATDLRARILLRHDLARFEAMEDLSWTFYAMAPAEFGVGAYRHFSSVAEPRKLLVRLLAGDIRPPCMETE